MRTHLKAIALLFTLLFASWGQYLPPGSSAPSGGSVGGGSSLTTVGAVPYVTSSGVLGQDQTAGGQFFWDSTNHRLGIGTVTPGNTLEVRGSANNGIAVYSIQNGGTGTTYGIYAQGSSAAATTNYGVYSQAIGNAGGITNIGGYFTAANGSTNYALITGNGNVGIGTTAPTYLLDVAKSGASGTLRVWDQTATTGTTGVVIQDGAGQSSTPELSILNSGSAVLWQTIGGDSKFQNTVGDVANTISLLTSVGLRFSNARRINWSSDATQYGTPDTGLSRDSAGVIDFGTGAQGSTAGSWKATNGTLLGNLNLQSVAFAALGTVPAAATTVYCNNCTTAATCAGAGAGHIAVSNGTNWTCQ